VNLDPDRARGISMFSFARRALVCLAAAAFKAPDELATLGLDGSLASQESPDIRAKENIRYELTQPQNTLTPTGLLMEGQCTHPAGLGPVEGLLLALAYINFRLVRRPHLARAFDIPAGCRLHS
jgi:hypothetical protein